MSASIKPSKKYEHLYAIVRFESEAAEGTPIDLRITVKKIVTDTNYAAQEVARLNELNADKGACYFSQVTRFEAPPVQSAPVSPLEATESPALDQPPSSSAK